MWKNVIYELKFQNLGKFKIKNLGEIGFILEMEIKNDTGNTKTSWTKVSTWI